MGGITCEPGELRRVLCDTHRLIHRRGEHVVGVRSLAFKGKKFSSLVLTTDRCRYVVYSGALGLAALRGVVHQLSPPGGAGGADETTMLFIGVHNRSNISHKSRQVITESESVFHAVSDALVWSPLVPVHAIDAGGGRDKASHSLPRIAAEDPQCQVLCARPGDVVAVRRHDLEDGRLDIYKRLVVRGV